MTERISGSCVHNWDQLSSPCPECAENKPQKVSSVSRIAELNRLIKDGEAEALKLWQAKEALAKPGTDLWLEKAFAVETLLKERTKLIEELGQ